MTWLRQNRLLVAGGVVLLTIGASLFAPAEAAPACWWIVAIAALTICAWLDHLRLCADIRAGRDRAWRHPR